LLLEARNHLVEQIVNLPDGSAARIAKEAELSRVLADLNQTSEALGVAAGRRFADDEGWTEQPVPRAGAGVPDLVFEDGDGRLIIIESKGPTGKPITRGATVGGEPVRAQQGTPEYLTSLARTMIGSGDPVLIKLGQRILDEMPDVGYFIVQQSVLPSGALGSVRVEEFDMRKPGQ